MDALVPVAAILAFVVAVYLGRRIVREDRIGAYRRAAAGRSGGPTSPGDVVLDVAYADPGTPAVKRLAAEAGVRALAARPGLREVRVLSRDGRLLRVVTREAPAASDVSVPLDLLEPRHRHHAHVPSLAHEDETADERIPWQEVMAGPGARPGAVHLQPPPAVHRTLAEAFDVPEGVRRLQADLDDLVDLVRAALQFAGQSVQVEEDTIRAGRTAVVVVPASLGSPVSPGSLNRAYLRFRASGATSGLVLTLGLMDHTDVWHRELFVPALRHAGPEGIQRMLDAVALGGEPLRFAAGLPA